MHLATPSENDEKIAKDKVASIPRDQVAALPVLLFVDHCLCVVFPPTRVASLPAPLIRLVSLWISSLHLLIVCPFFSLPGQLVVLWATTLLLNVPALRLCFAVLELVRCNFVWILISHLFLPLSR